ncbi:hypothetical protein A2U01_0005561 [Trifolium medium]|uniref:Uncharacterized protein n=1 Tax=Trifolium medium TaxID=97028 RepID=A0A392MBB1_9FABA|nr:hypothetical protein [Trifolium medium]
MNICASQLDNRSSSYDRYIGSCSAENLPGWLRLAEMGLFWGKICPGYLRLAGMMLRLAKDTVHRVKNVDCLLTF